MEAIKHQTVQEKWKVCIFNTNYVVSDLGRVKRYKVGKGATTGKILVPWLNDRGYLCVELSQNGCRKQYKVHKLVARAFVGKRPLNYVINHKDGITTNNTASNLEYTTQKENCRHSVRTGLQKAVMSIYQIRIAARCRALNSFGLVSFLAKCWELHKSTVYAASTGKTYYSRYFAKNLF